MFTTRHQTDDVFEFFKVHAFFGFERVLGKEWDNDVGKMLMASDSEGHPISMVFSHDAAFKVCLQGMQHLNIALMLDDGEFR